MNGQGGNQQYTAEFLYDFDVHGGVMGAIELGTLPLGAIVNQVSGVVETAVVGNNSTVILGTTDDDNGFVASTAEAAMVANAPVGTGIPAAMQPIANDDDSRDVVMKIGTANLTAGKVRFVLGFYIPSNIVVTE